MGLIKREIFASREAKCCARGFVREISAKKILSKMRIFLALNDSLSEKN